ncbi:c-type cytochrome [Campylobacter geochelonis]|uniref:Cytochrome c domain-containing protein n=1 Tax=Campylobacter geochelonis TaxID=1780362 RepID=A0A128EKA9_9BACT|nr:c-type cytochrome [Campylobacter geochelonis]QKF71638.1 hypothetical protein CGEO_1345 [Campylobacter geochelonis]CZE49385.1 Uncharacterised protein [Campylobacter geochelonis]CZE51554.1 Uncharacterised protein [Campylobacter geochelonis]
MRVLLVLSVFCSVLLSESFITDLEYGNMLYKNPRGIGCNRCHGLKGEGMIISKYKEYNQTSEKKDEKVLKAPAINSLSLQEFADGIVEPKGVMPSYFLTQNEIIVLYKYLKEINKEKK